jgi:hypothetical protein
VTKKIDIRFSEKLADRIEADAKRKGISKSQWFREASAHFLTCPKAEKVQSMKLIPFKYRGSCLKCGRTVEVGEWGLWGKGVGVICMDCYVGRIGDKALVAKYLKMREYKQIIKALKNQADELADKVEDLVAGDKFVIVYEEIHKGVTKALEYLTEKLGTPKENEAFEDFLRWLEKAKKVILDIESALERQGYWIKKKKKKKARYAS